MQKISGQKSCDHESNYDEVTKRTASHRCPTRRDSRRRIPDGPGLIAADHHQERNGI
jgi:hypothetical protein